MNHLHSLSEKRYKNEFFGIIICKITFHIAGPIMFSAVLSFFLIIWLYWKTFSARIYIEFHNWEQFSLPLRISYVDTVECSEQRLWKLHLIISWISNYLKWNQSDDKKFDFFYGMVQLFTHYILKCKSLISVDYFICLGLTTSKIVLYQLLMNLFFA